MRIGVGTGDEPGTIHVGSTSEGRLVTVRVLGRAKRKRNREALTEALRDSDERVRVQALLGLGWRRDRRRYRFVRFLMRDTSADVRALAAYAAGYMAPETGPDLVPLLGDPCERVRAAACSSLGRIAYHPALSSLRGLLTDSEPVVRASACWALGQMRDGESETALLGAAGDENVSVRFEAGGALLRLQNARGRSLLEAMLARREAPDFIEAETFLCSVRHVLKHWR